MLVTTMHHPQRVTLIANSGIQFLDFSLTTGFDEQWPSKFVRQTANGPLLRLDYDHSNGKYFLPTALGEPGEVVRPECGFSLEQSLRLLQNVWLPLPFLRFSSPHHFLSGPDNWVRLHIRLLEQTEQPTQTLHLTLAFDTRVYSSEADHPHLAPNQQDLMAGFCFALAHDSHHLNDFLDSTWVDGWLREVFSQQAHTVEQRSDGEISNALREFEYQAHYLNLLTLLATQFQIPEISFIDTSTSAFINVDLILDVGNSHTCGILVEDHPAERSGLRHSYELQLRDLSEPIYRYGGFFPSRTEFAPAPFGKQHYSFESGRDDAFAWPTLTRIGHEADRLSKQRQGDSGSTGLSSPRRYLWDEESYTAGWRFNHTGGNSLNEPPAIGFPFSQLINDEGKPLYCLPLEQRLPVFSAQYSRSSLMALMLSELLAQALTQMNSVVQRQLMGNSTSPRRLRTIILTLPSAMPAPEREIFRQRMEEAIVLVWKAMGWDPTDEKPKEDQSLPSIQMEWDEATCGQMVYLYNEIKSHYAGNANAFFTALAQQHSEKPRQNLRIASVDIGGGTTDLAIIQYRLQQATGSQANEGDAKIIPSLLFREGCKSAGDDLLLEIIQRYLLPALQTALKHAGVESPASLMAELFGRQEAPVLQQQVTLQLFIPLAQVILAYYEGFESQQQRSEIDALFGELLPHKPKNTTLQLINNEIKRGLPTAAPPFDILQVPLILNLSQLHHDFLATDLSISRHLRLLAEVITLYDCDVLLITGRPSCLPGIQALFRQLQPVPVHRIISMDGYHTSNWYPFHQQGYRDNPKSTAAVGAMLCLLALDLRLPGFYFKAADLQPYSTLRYLGRLNDNNLLPANQVYYADLNLDTADATLENNISLALNSDICLGFRQLDNEHWPATPLFTLTIIEPQLARKLAADNLLYVTLRLPSNSSARWTIASAKLADGSSVAVEQLQLKMNTLVDSTKGATHYWIDSGKIFI